MTGSAFSIFWIVVVVFLSLDFIGAIVLCVLENKLKKAHPANEGELSVEKATTHVTGEDIYLHVTDGVVTVIDELPTVEVEVKKSIAGVLNKDVYLHVAQDGEVTVVDNIAGVMQREIVREVPVEVVKEVIKEVPVEVIKEVVKEVPVEVIKEVPVEVVKEVPYAAMKDADVDDDDIIDDGEEAVDPGKVVFIASERKLTYLDKLAALDKKTYALYEQLVNYLLSKDNVKQVTTNNNAIFKFKTDRLVISTVRRGVITLQFMLINSSLERYMRAEGAKEIKITPVTIRLTDEESLERAKGTADLTIDYIEQEREYNAEQKKAARREARRAKAEAERAAAAAADTTAE